MPLMLKSPKATQVKAIHSADDTKVSAGDFLLELYDYEEQKILSQIDRAIAENALKAQEAAGVEVSNKVGALKQISDERIVTVEASRFVFEAVLEGRRLGERTLVDVVRARQDLALRSYQALQGAIEYEIFRRNALDAVDVYKTVDSLLKKERDYVERSSSRLRIRAPRDGHFHCFVSVGTPVRLGHLLGEVA